MAKKWLLSFLSSRTVGTCFKLARAQLHLMADDRRSVDDFRGADGLPIYLLPPMQRQNYIFRIITNQALVYIHGSSIFLKKASSIDNKDGQLSLPQAIL